MTARVVSIKSIALGVAALCLIGAHDARATERVDAERAVLSKMLRAYEPRVSAEALRRIGPDVNDLLIQFEQAPNVIKYMRLRALAWLRFYPTTATRQVLMEILAAKRQDVGFKRTALRTLALAFGPDAFGTIKGYLADGDAYMREAAVYALGDIADSRVDPLLREHEGSESSIAVRDAIERVLRARAKSAH